MDKERLIERIEDTLEEVDNTLKRLNEGDMTFSEVGDYYHSSLGDDVSIVLKNVLKFINHS